MSGESRGKEGKDGGEIHRKGRRKERREGNGRLGSKREENGRNRDI